MKTPIKKGTPINIAPEPKKFITHCAECGRELVSYNPIPRHWLCEACKVKLEATPVKIFEHAAKIAKERAEERGY